MKKVLILILICFFIVTQQNNVSQIKPNIKTSKTDTLIMWKGKPIPKKDVIDSLNMIFKKFNDSLIIEQKKIEKIKVS